MEKNNNEYLYRWKDDLRIRQHEAVNDLHLCWKVLKINFQKIFLIIGKIFHCFYTTMYDIFKLHMDHRVHKNKRH